MNNDEKYGLLTPVRFVKWHRFPSGGREAKWKFACDCGGVIVCNLSSVRKGLTKSCGCLLAKEKLKNRAINSYLILGQKSVTVKKLESLLRT